MRTLTLFLLLTGALFADSPQSKKIEFSEGDKKYYALAVVDGMRLTGFRIFADKARFIQLVDWVGVDLSDYNPEYIQTAFQLADYNFDGYPDIILPGDGSTARFPYVEVWLWNQQQKKFVSNSELDDAYITSIDAKKKYLYSHASEGHESHSLSAYIFSPQGKLVLVYTTHIDGRKNTETTTYYSDGKVTKTVTTVPPSEQ